ncbi:FkbM family methyltransferase [Pelagibacterales bacterium SAG-MED09]|nr:FkbM family methyltransferase [Pelagibacterales bacterium SAG-MED09]
MNYIKKIIQSPQHRQLIGLKIGIKILNWMIKYFNYKGDIMVNRHGSFVGTDGVFLSTKGTNRYLKSNSSKKINQGANLNENIKKILNSVKIILDIGANVGEISIYLSKMYQNSKIYSIEPSKRNLLIFKKNLDDQFDECSNITIIEKAVCDYNGKIDITSSLNAANTIMINHELNRTLKSYDKKIIDHVEEVDAITLNELCKQNHITEIDFMKVDIEGAEPLLTPSILDLKPRLIFIEISLKNTENNYQEMLSKLEKLYDIYDNNLNIIEDIKLFVFNLFSKKDDKNKIIVTDVWLVRNDLNFNSKI